MFKRLLAHLAACLLTAFLAAPAAAQYAPATEVAELRTVVRDLRKQVHTERVRREQAQRDLQAARDQSAALASDVARQRERLQRLESSFWAAVIAGLVIVVVLVLPTMLAQVLRPQGWDAAAGLAPADAGLREGLRGIEARMRALETESPERK